MVSHMHDHTTRCRKTGGDVPDKLVGASTTVLGSKMYFFGGKLSKERRLVSDLYVFDFETLLWEQMHYYPGNDVPSPRYFHSANAWNNHLIIFGGMSNKLNSSYKDELCVLNDIRFFDLSTKRWIPGETSFSPQLNRFSPPPRYGHLSSITGSKLFVIGGQDLLERWLDDICVFDLDTRTWVQRRDYPRHCGTYRSVAVSSQLIARFPQDEKQMSQFESMADSAEDSSRLKKNTCNPSKSFIHQPYSAISTNDHPSDVLLYNNYNFTDVKREFNTFSPLSNNDFSIQNRYNAMSGTSFPPGLRFPTGAVVGNHFIIAGTHVAHNFQSFLIWALELKTMTWLRIDPGKTMQIGSWSKGCLWADTNKYFVFGNRHGNATEDYSVRLSSWDHVVIVDLEAHGIYQPPLLKLDIRMQELGLSVLEEGVLADFEVICNDGQKIPCSRRMLEDRWPWFKEQRKQLLKKTQYILSKLPACDVHVPLPEVAGNEEEFGEERIDPRITPRSFYLAESYSVTLALLQYFYSLSLITPLQHSPSVLNQLLILSCNYDIRHLESLVKQAMYRSLSNSTCIKVFEVAVLCNSFNLQLQALQIMMSHAKRSSQKSSDKGSGSNVSRALDGGRGRPKGGRLPKRSILPH